MRRKIEICKVLMFACFIIAIFLFGMAFCLIFYREYLIADKNKDYIIYAVVGTIFFIIQLMLGEFIKMEQEKAHDRFIQLLEEFKKEQEKEGEE